MKKQPKIVLILSMIIAFLFFSKIENAAAFTEVTSDITIATTWTKVNSPYVIRSYIYINAPLTIEPGTIIKFDYKRGAKLEVKNELNAIGNENERIIFTSLRDDTFSGDTNGDADLTKPNVGDWTGIQFYLGSKGIFDYVSVLYALSANIVLGSVTINSTDNVTIRNSEIKYSGYAGLFIYNAQPTIENNTFSNNLIGVFLWSNRNAVIRKNRIVDNVAGAGVYGMNFEYKLDAQDNWWGDKSGPYFKHTYFGTDNLTGKGNSVSDGVLFDSWLGSDPTVAESGCQKNCFSNVMFLPGIKASKLYLKRNGEMEDQLWPPNYLGNDLTNLNLYNDGKSIEKVFTKDAISEIGSPLIGGNIYKTFLQMLADLKSQKIINDYESFAYDWRMDVQDIAKNGTLYPEDEIKSAIADIEKLAQTSKSKKVTIIAHSNGGLLAKAIMLELESRNLADRVDKIVFVATPQMGTPLATLSLLYGYEESALFGTLISRAESRELAENMPGAYGLLPSEKYFQQMENPFITFSSEKTWYNKFKKVYGDDIDSAAEFKKFLSGADDLRVKPEKSDVEFENILNESLLTKAQQMHESLDAWIPTDNIKVIQLAGWGLDTISGVEYTEKEKTDCKSTFFSIIPKCTGTGEYEPVYDPKFTVDGDKVVVAPSALLMLEKQNVKNYWVDLWSYDDLLTTGKSHKDILEVNSVENFLQNIIKNINQADSLPEYFKTTRPSDYDNAKPRLRMSLYSPLDVHLFDSAGNHTGPKIVTIDGQQKTIFEQSIPNSYYYQFGDRKYFGVPAGENVQLKMEGYATGSYTLKMEEVNITENGDETISRTTFENLPVSTETNVSLEIPESGLESLPSLQSDYDGNGSVDYVVTPVLNGVATLDNDVTAPETKIELSGNQAENGWLKSNVTVTLSASDNDSGVAETSYSLDNGATWKKYSDELVFSQEGIFDVSYFSTDNQNNKEEIKKTTIKIDKTAPEISLAFNFSTQKLDILGKDNFSQNVSLEIKEEIEIQKNKNEMKNKFWFFNWIHGVIQTKNIVTAQLKDEAGHETKVIWEKSLDKDHRIDLKMISISYDGEKTDISDASLQYKWALDWRKKKYVLFASHINSKTIAIESHFFPGKNQTWLMEKPREIADDDNDNDAQKRPIRKKMSGMVIPSIITEKGIVNMNYYLAKSSEI